MTSRTSPGSGSPRGSSRGKGAAPVSAALRELLSLLNLPAVDALVRLHQGWDRVAGPTVASKARPDRLRGGVLTVRVENHSWAQELSLQRPVLLAKLAALLGEGVVKELRFEAEPFAPPPRKDGRGAKERPGALPPLPEPEGLSELADPEMREILLSIQRRAAARERDGE